MLKEGVKKKYIYSALEVSQLQLWSLKYARLLKYMNRSRKKKIMKRVTQKLMGRGFPLLNLGGQAGTKCFGFPSTKCSVLCDLLQH